MGISAEQITVLDEWNINNVCGAQLGPLVVGGWARISFCIMAIVTRNVTRVCLCVDDRR